MDSKWVVGLVAMAGVWACDAGPGAVERVRNDRVVAGTADTPTRGVAFDSIQLRFRGERDGVVGPTPSGDFGPSILSGALPAPSIPCTGDEQCGEEVCAGASDGIPGLCSTSADITSVECGIYDVRFTSGGTTCEIIVNPSGTDGSNQTCTVRADCPASHRCNEGQCEYQYTGDGLWICFNLNRWDLARHLATRCADLFAAP